MALPCQDIVEPAAPCVPGLVEQVPALRHAEHNLVSTSEVPSGAQL